MSRTIRCRALLWVLGFVLPGFSPVALAHRLDEYLQATLVTIDPDSIHVQIDLTPGVAVADQILAQIDRDHDGAISSAEAAAYAQWLQRDVIARLDEDPLELKLIASNFPEPSELRSGSGIIQVEFSLAPISLTKGTHRLTLENRHMPAISVYLINATLPKSNSIRIIRQIRNDNQSSGTIEFSFTPPESRYRTLALAACVASLVIGVFAGLRQTRTRPQGCNHSDGKATGETMVE